MSVTDTREGVIGVVIIISSKGRKSKAGVA